MVASALAGGDCIDDTDALRAGGTVGVLGCVVKAPSTLGTFLRSFRQTGPLPHGRPLLMAVCGVESNIGNLPAESAQTANVSGGFFISVRHGVPSGGAPGMLPVQDRSDGVGQSFLAPSNSGIVNANGEMTRCSIARPMALSWSMDPRKADDLDLVVPQPAQQIQHLGHRPAQAVQRPTFTQSPGCKAAFKRRSPDRFHEAPLPTP